MVMQDEKPDIDLKSKCDPLQMDGWNYLWNIGLKNENPVVRDKANTLAAKICLVFEL